MPDVSANLSLPYILPNQAQKHVTHNEGMRILDVVTQLSVLSADLTEPPTDAVDGDRYIVGAGATGAWSSKDGQIAVSEVGAWTYIAPVSGWVAWVQDVMGQQAFDGTSWMATGGGMSSQVPTLGISTTADSTNRLAVIADATLLSHDGAGHQLKLNKAAPSDTASLLFQTGWSGRAEMGTAGNDDFAIKVSPDGATFLDAIVVNGTTGHVSFPSGAAGTAGSPFGAGAVINVDYAIARGVDLIANSTGLLGTGYNYPANAAFDPIITPDLPASFSFAGPFSGEAEMSEFVPVDPNQAYRLGSYLRQEFVSGDWSAFPKQERHAQYMGLLCFDVDEETILARHHMRYRHGGTDSRTYLTAPLTPGDTSVSVADASGWNEVDTAGFHRGLIIFGYKNSGGGLYSDYSRLVAFDLFELGGVNKTTGVVTLNQPLPASLGNPDDVSGTWPIGTPLANCSNGSAYRYAFYGNLTVEATDTWYKTVNYIGGIDRSGTNEAANFPPGTALAKVFWLPNFTNRPGGYSGYPYTGDEQRLWVSGASVTPDYTAVLEREAAGAASGRVSIKIPTPEVGTGQVTLAVASLKVSGV